MPRVVYIEHDGVQHAVSGVAGHTLMESAIVNGVPGILAACGGDGGCATCQVYVDEAWAAVTGTASSRERNTLRFAFEPNAHSRLACQIVLTEELDGLVVHLPSDQY